jgi:hypothetical protein
MLGLALIGGLASNWLADTSPEPGPPATTDREK